ncbi:hypothetical protein ACLKA6_005497 [Drosophila palustris]
MLFTASFDIVYSRQAQRSKRLVAATARSAHFLASWSFVLASWSVGKAVARTRARSMPSSSTPLVVFVWKLPKHCNNMDENAGETSIDAKTTEGEQFSTSGRHGIESEHLEISTKGFSENEEGEGGGEEDGKATEEGNPEEGDESEMSPEALKAKERARKKKKREEMKLARAMLDRHYKAPVAEPEPEPEPELEEKDLLGEEDAEDGDMDRQSAKEKESSLISLQAEDNLINLKDDDYIPIAPKIDETDTALEMFLDIGHSATHIRAESTTAMEVERAAKEVRQVVFTFLAKMIDEAVDTAEYVDPIKELRGKLDKHKLYIQLQKLYGQYLAAKFFNVDVNNKMYDYYRRVGQLRCFDVLPPKVELVEYYRYMDAIHLLDHLKQKINETKKTNSELLASVKMDLDFVHNMAHVSVHALETTMRDVLLRKDAEFLPRIVENDLRRMQKMRNEVSDSRLWLITRQHTLGSLLERKRNFDQIAEDLTMDQFLVTQREVTALGTKVEERNHDLNRMRDRCTKHMHQLAFIREKTSMNSATLCNKKIELDEKLLKQKQLRAKLLKLKIQHSSLKIQKAELHEKCGLLFKPALLHDFDKTVEHIEVKRERVKKLRKTVVELESRIDEFEKQARESEFSYWSRQTLLRKTLEGITTKR